MNEPTLRRFLRAALAGALLFGSASSFADTEVVDGIEWTYTIANGEAWVGGDDYSPAVPRTTAGEIEIPSALGGCPVTTIKWEAFSDCSELTSITIPDGVTIIEGLAFSGCSGLTSITIPESVISIGGEAFGSCSESQAGARRQPESVSCL